MWRVHNDCPPSLAFIPSRCFRRASSLPPVSSLVAPTSPPAEDRSQTGGITNREEPVQPSFPVGTPGLQTPNFPVIKSQCSAFRAASVVPVVRSRNWRARMTVAGACAVLQNRKNRTISRRWFSRTSGLSSAESSAVDQSGKLNGRCPKESIAESMPTHCPLVAVIGNCSAYPNEGFAE